MGTNGVDDGEEFSSDVTNKPASALEVLSFRHQRLRTVGARPL